MIMPRIHIALAVADFSDSLADYTERLGQKPCCTVDGKYALWRTDILNFSISVNPEQAGVVRHLGFECEAAEEMTAETDANGMLWESFSARQQKQEILRIWPDAQFST